MSWKKQPLTYNICIPPLKKSPYDFTNYEAKQYFNWYLQVLPERIEYLISVCVAESGYSKEQLNLSPESLKLLWKWFLSAAKIEDMQGIKQFTLQTEYIMRDIGMYLGETIVESLSGLAWGYYEEPKSDFFVNRPVLIGFLDKQFTPPFPAAFEPIHMVRVQAAKIFKSQAQESDLYSLYRKWERMCPDK